MIHILHSSRKRWSVGLISISVSKCCILNVGKVTQTACFNINGGILPVVTSARDLGVTVSHDLSPASHISNIVAKAHKRTAAIYRAFTCRNVDLYLCVLISFMYGLLLNMTL